MMKLITTARDLNVDERTCNALRSTGCQPVLFGSLPKSLWNVRRSESLCRIGSRRQAAYDNRLAACAPQTTRDRRSLLRT
jgi:hypothetical protein